MEIPINPEQDNLTLNLNENATNAINQATINTNANTSTIANLKKNLWKEEEEFRNKSSISEEACSQSCFFFTTQVLVQAAIKCRVQFVKQALGQGMRTNRLIFFV